MKSFITHFVTLTLLVALLYSVVMGQENITATVVSAYWVVILLAIFICTITMVAVGLVSAETDPVKKEKLMKYLEVASKKPGIMKRVYNWICLVLIVGGLAYGGWVFTAVCYAIVALMVRLFFSIARDKTNEIHAAS
nr:hypothetical protein [uncultured Enterobacter sp.]DAI87025.1 MAG TPA: hypothetical protein [Caudoviricetes sp.]